MEFNPEHITVETYEKMIKDSEMRAKWQIVGNLLVAKKWFLEMSLPLATQSSRLTPLLRLANRASPWLGARLRRWARKREKRHSIHPSLRICIRCGITVEQIEESIRAVEQIQIKLGYLGQEMATAVNNVYTGVMTAHYDLPQSQI